MISFSTTPAVIFTRRASDRQALRPDVVRSARIVSAYRGITMAEYLSEVLRPIGNVPGGLRVNEPTTTASPDFTITMGRDGTGTELVRSFADADSGNTENNWPGPNSGSSDLFLADCGYTSVVAVRRALRLCPIT
jgi:hypothetical protein